MTTTPALTPNDSKSKHAQFAIEEDDGVQVMDEYETDKDNWFYTGLESGIDNSRDSSFQDSEDKSDSSYTSTPKDDDNRDTKIVQSCFHIDLKGFLSLHRLAESEEEKEYQLSATVTPQQPDYLDETYKNNYYVALENDDTQSLFEYETIDIYTKLIVFGYLRSFTFGVLLDNDNIINLITKYFRDNEIIFNQKKMIKDSLGNDQVLLLSDHGLKYGIHQWGIKIEKCDVYLQEIGVIATNTLDNIKFLEDGIKGTDNLGARAIYGNMLLPQRKNYYASYNQNGSVRCDKDLTDIKIHKDGWKEGDVIIVELNMREGYVRFYLNDKKVRKVISLQGDKIWYPVISWTGNCQYELINFATTPR